MPLQQLAEESFGGFLITARLDEDIDYITILVYRAPEVLAFTLYLYEDLVQVPCVTETTLPTLQSPSVFRPELNAPQSDRFVRNRDASLSEYVVYYHHERNHQGKENLLLFPAIDQLPQSERKVRSRERLGGLLRFYHREAA